MIVTTKDVDELTRQHSREIVDQNGLFAREDGDLKMQRFKIPIGDRDAHDELNATMRLHRLDKDRRRYDLYVSQKRELAELERQGATVDYTVVDNGINSYGRRVQLLADDLRTKGEFTDAAAALAQIG